MADIKEHLSSSAINALKEGTLLNVLQLYTPIGINNIVTHAYTITYLLIITICYNKHVVLTALDHSLICRLISYFNRAY